MALKGKLSQPTGERQGRVLSNASNKGRRRVSRSMPVRPGEKSTSMSVGFDKGGARLFVNSGGKLFSTQLEALGTKKVQDVTTSFDELSVEYLDIGNSAAWTGSKSKGRILTSGNSFNIQMLGASSDRNIGFGGTAVDVKVVVDEKKLSFPNGDGTLTTDGAYDLILSTNNADTTDASIDDNYIKIEDGAAGDIILKANGADIQLDAADGKVEIKNDNALFGTIDTNTGSTFKFLSNVGFRAVVESQGIGGVRLDSSADIEIDSATGKFMMSKAGTEFSVADSAYAGMILGYTTVGIDATTDTYTLTDTMVALAPSVTTSDLKVRFRAPPSGVVEIFASIYWDASRRLPVLGLSDNATYSAIDFPNASDVTNEHVQAMPPSSYGDSILRPRWVVTGLTSGTVYEWWLGAKTTSHVGGVLKWGGTATNQYPPFIMKATALPTAVSHLAVYG